VDVSARSILISVYQCAEREPESTPYMDWSRIDAPSLNQRRAATGKLGDVSAQRFLPVSRQDQPRTC
jgi:hypothetical protein